MCESSHCSYCSSPITGESIRLWDNRDYCRSCIERTCPELHELAAAACAYASATSEGWKAAKKRLSPLVGALVFAAIGLKFGGTFGIPGLIIFAIVNGTLGALVGWACQVRIRAVQSEHEASQQFGSVRD